MIFFRAWKATLVVTALLAAATALSEEQQCQSIKTWTRRAGDYRGGNEVARLNEASIQLVNLKAKARLLFDAQYQEKKEFKAVSINELLASTEKSSSTNMVLLHFRNKMILPLSVSELGHLKDKIYMATAIKAEKAWTTDFPIVQREDPMWRDPRPIRFCASKIVVPDPWAFRLAGQNTTIKSFSPWQYVDTLVGIEFVNREAYFAQFAVGQSPLANEGFQVFKNRCQFCHGAQQVGASMGWDYAGPIPAYEKRQPDSLLLHVKYEKAEKFSLGTIMPAQSDMQMQESKAMWNWLRDVAKFEVRPYLP